MTSLQPTIHMQANPLRAPNPKHLLYPTVTKPVLPLPWVTPGPGTGQLKDTGRVWGCHSYSTIQPWIRSSSPPLPCPFRHLETTIKPLDLTFSLFLLLPGASPSDPAWRGMPPPLGNTKGYTPFFQGSVFHVCHRIRPISQPNLGDVSQKPPNPME